MFASVGKVARSACAPVREARGKGQRGLPPGFVWLFGLVGVIPVPLDPASRAAVVAPWPTKKKVFERGILQFFHSSRADLPRRGPGALSEPIFQQSIATPVDMSNLPLESSSIWVTGFLKRRLFGL
jgi:hypothetical protein